MNVDHPDDDDDGHDGDGPTPLEAELSAMRPRALPAGLAARIVASAADRAGSPTPQRAGRWSDRCLRIALGIGAAAACVIVGTVMTDPGGGLPPPAAVVSVQSGVPRAGDSLAAFARADAGWTGGADAPLDRLERRP
jgi:hypothetical protein